MTLAQRLYEAGYITYMRTDSDQLVGTRLKWGGVYSEAVRNEYLPEIVRAYTPVKKVPRKRTKRFDQRT